MRRIALSMITVAAVALITGCGDDTSAQTGAELAEYSSVAELVEATTEASAEHETAHMTMTSSDPAVGGQNVEGRIRFGDQTALSVSSTSESGGPGGVVMQDGIVYLNMGEEVVPGKSWVRIDPEEKSDGLGELLRMVARQMVRSGDPNQALVDYAGSAEITATAEDEIDGTPTIRYDIEVDFQKLVDSVDDQLTEQMLRSALALGTKTATYSMWVDGRDLPIRFEIESPSAEGTMITSTVDYVSWGESVQIEIPPADQTADLDDLRTPGMAGQGS